MQRPTGWPVASVLKREDVKICLNAYLRQRNINIIDVFLQGNEKPTMTRRELRNNPDHGSCGLMV